MITTKTIRFRKKKPETVEEIFKDYPKRLKNKPKSSKEERIRKNKSKQVYYSEHSVQFRKSGLAYRHSSRGKFLSLYRSIRVSHTKLTDIVLLSPKEYLEFGKENSSLWISLMSKWKRSRYSREASPTVTRIDLSKGFSKNNIKLSSYILK